MQMAMVSEHHVKAVANPFQPLRCRFFYVDEIIFNQYLCISSLEFCNPRSKNLTKRVKRFIYRLESTL